jgi:Bacterial TSP3 repeat
MRTLWMALVVTVTTTGLATGCGPASKDPPDAGPAPIADADGDGISDAHEGAAAQLDTDRDGTPDYRDLDSDGDSLGDAAEAGDHDLTTPPFDSDGDKQPDFRDLDSDGNERDDQLEGLDDLDSDGLGNFADLDNDGDNIPDIDELGPNPSVAADTDNDGTPDLHDRDSDSDSIDDLFETGADFDSDGLANFRDLDSDGDCRADQVERGAEATPRDSDRDRRYDFLDRDSDNDGVADRTEDTSCDGAHAAPESSAIRPDTDGDGVSDLIEREAGTDPNSAADNPRVRGDFVFVMPYQQPQLPLADNLDFKPALANVDLYVLIDRSESMANETQSIKNSLGGVIRDLQCAPVGNGAPGDCIPNLHAGLGGIGYETQQPFVHYLPIQQSPNFAGTSIPNVNDSETREPLVFGVWTALSNADSALANGTYGCRLDPVVANTSCPPGTYGQACFRPGSLPVVVLATDEQPLQAGADTVTCPGWSNVALPALGARKAKLVGVYGSSPLGMTISNLITMATDTGSIDSSAGNAPLVFNGADAGAAAAIGAGIRALVRGVPLDMRAVAVDGTGDPVNAVAAFVDYLETLQLGDARCANGLIDDDSDGDGHDDQFRGVRAGVPLCWKLAAKQNRTVPELDAPQLFRARVDVVGDGVTVVDSRDVFFLVPPRAIDDPIE